MRETNTRALAIAAILAAASGAATADVTTSEFYAGSVHGIMGGLASGGAGDVAGAITLSGIPAGATILSAKLYTNTWFSPGDTPSATFDGFPMGPTGAFDVDSDGAGLAAYKWDVTSLITGDGAYGVHITGGAGMYGAALAVIFDHPSLPFGVTILNDGASSVGEAGPDAEGTFFAGGLPGPGDLWLYTQADDLIGTGETIFFNGAPIGGPIDENLGPYASLFHLPVSVTGGDVASLHSPADFFGWHVALLNSSIPAPGSLALLGLAACAATLRRR